MNLKELINLRRNQMIELGLTKGLTHKDTIQCSQSLDLLLNMYSKQQSTKELTRYVI